MATITPGTNATITANTIEAYLCGAIWLLQNLEADAARNPSGINNITSSISDDNRTLTGNCTFSGIVTSSATGQLIITCVDYLTTPSGQPAHYSPGTGGTINSATIQGAIFEAARTIDLLENDSSKNTQGLKTISWNVTNGEIGSEGRAIINIGITNFPLTFAFNANGTQSLQGKNYLL